jgi:hypothetical protein
LSERDEEEAMKANGHGRENDGHPVITEEMRQAEIDRYYVQDKGSDDDDSGPVPDRWPADHEPAALHGLAGDFVRTIAPHTEADPAGLLMECLVAAGNLIGRLPFRNVGPVSHHTNTYDVLVGETGTARKGSTWAEVRRVFTAVDPKWTERIVGGLSSGEGLIWAVRDSTMKKGEDGEMKVIDPGIADKRLMVVETEFARTLRACERHDSILSHVIRQAWDTGALEILNKNSPARASDAHVSIIGHTTTEELERSLNTTEAANGFANRFTWTCVRRSKLLPFGGNPTPEELDQLKWRLRGVVDWARKAPGELMLSTEAAAAWEKAYPGLTEGHPGMLGAILQRAEAHVLRFSIIYAALDCSTVIELQHLRAALAVWKRAAASASYIFKQRLGDPDADAILDSLRAAKDGLTRTDISNIFGRHLPSARIERALAVLRQKNLAQPDTAQTGGRPIERWKAVRNR